MATIFCTSSYQEMGQLAASSEIWTGYMICFEKFNAEDVMMYGFRSLDFHLCFLGMVPPPSMEVQVTLR